jgi:hypothetical protein
VEAQLSQLFPLLLPVGRQLLLTGLQLCQPLLDLCQLLRKGVKKGLITVGVICWEYESM